MSKIIVPLHFAKLTTTPGNVGTGFKKFYLKGEWFKLFDGASEIDVVLDRPLDGFTPLTGSISSSDTVLTALEKLQYGLSNVSASATWGNITGNILTQTDLISYLSGTYYPLSNPAGYITSFYGATHYYPLYSNPAAYLTQESVLEFATFGDFPATGAPNTIYISMDDNIGYYWDGAAYQVVTSTTSGITGFGTTNYIPKFTPNGATLGNSKIYEDTTGRVVVNYQPTLSLLNGGAIFSIQRAQSQLAFALGSSGAPGQPTVILCDNDPSGVEVASKGEFAINTGVTDFDNLATYNNALRILKNGKIFLGGGDSATSTKGIFNIYNRVSGTYSYLVKQGSAIGETYYHGTRTTWADGTGVEHVWHDGNEHTYLQYAWNRGCVIGSQNTGTSRIELGGNVSGNYGLTRFFNLNTETLRIGSDGKLILYTTPDTGASTDYILLRDTSGNIKQIAYTTPAASTSTIKHLVKNDGTASIAKGVPVYVTGADGTNMLVGKAGNGSEATSSKTMGLMESTITTTGGTQTGYVVTEGLLGGLNTAGTTAGDPVWLGPSGTLIYGLINKPYAPAHLVFIGIVTKVSAGNGEIFVKVQNGFELSEIHDVDLKTTTPVNGHLLGFDGTLWVNKTIAGWLGYTPVTNARNINTSSPLQGGGDMSADRTLSILQASTSQNGYLSSTDWNTFNGKQTATKSAILSTLGYYDYKNTTLYSTTGVTTEVQLLQVTIPANTFSASDLLKFFATFIKVNGGSPGAVTIRVKISTSSTMPTGTTGTIASYSFGAAQGYVQMSRKMVINGGNIYGYSFTSSALDDVATITTAISSVALDITQQQYFYVSATPANGGDTFSLRSIQITNI